MKSFPEFLNLIPMCDVRVPCNTMTVRVCGVCCVVCGVWCVLCVVCCVLCGVWCVVCVCTCASGGRRPMVIETCCTLGTFLAVSKTFSITTF